MPSLGLAHPRGRFRFDRLTPALLRKIARFPSYLAPRAADLLDPTTFQPPIGPYDADDLTGRAFIANGTTRTTVRLVAVQPFMAALAASPHLANLRRLDLSGNRIGPDGARALAASPYLGGLRELGLNGNAIGSAGAAALTAAPWLAGLTRLEVADNGLTAADVRLLLDAAPRLERVDGSGNVGVALRPGLREVIAARVGSISVGSGDRFPQQVVPPHPAPTWDTLESLDLRHNRLGPAGVAALLATPFPALTRLDLGFNDCERLPAAAFPALRTLSLRANRLTTLPDILSAPLLTALDLSVNQLGNAAAEVVRLFPTLTHLDLSNTGLTDAGLVRLLATLPRNLRSLSLAWNPLGDAAAAALLAATHLEALKLTGCRVARGLARALGDRFGTITV